MITWLDYLCTQITKFIDEKWHSGDSRKALAYHIGQEILAFQNGIPPENILDETFRAMLAPFIAEYIPAGGSLTVQERKPARPLGILPLCHKSCRLDRIGIWGQG
jgi:hypothetical protein